MSSAAERAAALAAARPVPSKVSDIEINRVFEVVCEECGVIDAPRSYETAIASRRDHWLAEHSAKGGDRSA